MKENKGRGSYQTCAVLKKSLRFLGISLAEFLIIWKINLSNSILPWLKIIISKTIPVSKNNSDFSANKRTVNLKKNLIHLFTRINFFQTDQSIAILEDNPKSREIYRKVRISGNARICSVATPHLNTLAGFRNSSTVSYVRGTVASYTEYREKRLETEASRQSRWLERDGIRCSSPFNAISGRQFVFEGNLIPRQLTGYYSKALILPLSLPAWR